MFLVKIFLLYSPNWWPQFWIFCLHTKKERKKGRKEGREREKAREGERKERRGMRKGEREEGKGKGERGWGRGVMPFCCTTESLSWIWKLAKSTNSTLLRFTVGYEVTTKVSPLKHLCHKVNLHLFNMVVPSPRHTLESPGKDKTMPMPWSYPWGPASIGLGCSLGIRGLESSPVICKCRYSAFMKGLKTELSQHLLEPTMLDWLSCSLGVLNLPSIPVFIQWNGNNSGSSLRW